MWFVRCEHFHTIITTTAFINSSVAFITVTAGDKIHAVSVPRVNTRISNNLLLYDTSVEAVDDALKKHTHKICTYRLRHNHKQAVASSIMIDNGILTSSELCLLVPHGEIQRQHNNRLQCLTIHSLVNH